MKKVGILFGQESSFPPAFVQRVNEKGGGEIQAEFVRIDKVVQGEPCGYDVIVDRISQDVPFYRGFLKNAALTGTAVVNNPFWWSADEKFFNNALATKIGVAVPRTVLLPSHQVPPDTNDKLLLRRDLPRFHVCFWNLPNEFFDTLRPREIRGHTARICLEADALDRFIHALLCAPVNGHRCSLTCEQRGNRQPYPCSRASHNRCLPIQLQIHASSSHGSRCAAKQGSWTEETPAPCS